MPDDDPGEANRKSALAYAAAFGLFASVAGFCGIGWLLDRWLQTSPWLMVVGLIAGAIGGFYQFIRLASKIG